MGGKGRGPGGWGGWGWGVGGVRMEVSEGWRLAKRNSGEG